MGVFSAAPRLRLPRTHCALKEDSSNSILSENNLSAFKYPRIWNMLYVSQSYGIGESSAYDIIKWIKNTLSKHRDFALPGRKALLKSDMEYKLILIDATETPIERPKKIRVTE